MPEIKSLSDFYNPMQQVAPTVNLMTLMQQNQRLGLQEQQNTIELQRFEKTKQLDTFKTGLAEMRADPNVPQSKTLEYINQWAPVFQFPPMNANEYGAVGPALNQLLEIDTQTGTFAVPSGSPKEQEILRDMTRLSPTWGQKIQDTIRQRQGAQGLQELGQAAGRPLSLNQALAVQGSPQLQQQLGQAAFPGPRELAEADKAKAETRLLETKIASADLTAKEHARNDGLIQRLGAAKQELSRLETVQSVLPSGGSTEEWKVIAQADPNAAAFERERPQLAAAAQGELQGLEDEKIKLSMARSTGRGNRTWTPDDEALFTVRTEALNDAIELQARRSAFYSRPTQWTLRRLKEEVRGMETYVNETTIERDKLLALQQKQTEAGQQRADLGRLQQAQAEFAQSDRTPATAGKIAQKYGVLTDEVLKAGVDPTTKGQVNLNISPGERKDIAEERAQLREIQAVKNLYSDKFVGLLDNAVAKFKGPANLLTEDEAQFRASVKKMGAGLRKFYAGTAQSKQELKNLVESIPDTDMSETQFKAALQATEDNVTRMVQEQVAVGQEVGAKTPSAKPGGGKSDPRAQQLRQAFPGVPDQLIEQFLQGR